MRKFLSSVALVLALASPVAARADVVDIIVEGSLGKGVKLKPNAGKFVPTTVMLAPGLTFLKYVRAQVGVVGELPDEEGAKFDLTVRPMLTLDVPVLPIYARAIFAFTNLLHKESRAMAYGGALGFNVNVPILDIGVFGEAALLPQSKNDAVTWIAEARAGVSLSF